MGGERTRLQIGGGCQILLSVVPLIHTKKIQIEKRADPFCSADPTFPYKPGPPRAMPTVPGPAHCEGNTRGEENGDAKDVNQSQRHCSQVSVKPSQRKSDGKKFQ